jgi:predicted AAA+ superfamily ATPase
LLFFLPVFSHSAKAQLINPRKVYAIDLGLVNVVANAMTDNKGHKLENLVFLHLRRKYKELYYFAEKGECDFVAMKRGQVIELLQVCYELTPDNLQRETNGLFQAMRFFNIHEAKIVTFSGNDFIQEGDLSIEVLPAYRYLTQPNV